MDYIKKIKLKLYWNLVPYHIYKLLRMEEYFLKKQEQIDFLTKDLEDKKYSKLCFIDLIDNGSEFKVDQYGVTIYVKTENEPSAYNEKSKYLTNLASIYDQINECIDKVKIRYEPNLVLVKPLNSECIKITVDNKDGRLHEEAREKERLESKRRSSRYASSGRLSSY